MKERIEEDNVKSLWDFMIPHTDANGDMAQTLLNLAVFMENKGYRYIELYSRKTMAHGPNYAFEFRSNVKELGQ